MESEKLSIIIACYNDHKYLTEAVMSACAQTWENKEVILVDDGSNERTQKLIKTLKPKIDILITQKNQGVSSARNNGIKAATGEYILILDSDDFFEPGFSSKAILTFRENKNISIVTCFSRWFNSQTDWKIFEPRGGTIKDALIKNVAMGSSMFKKESWRAVNGYDENMQKGYEDWEFYIRVLQNGGIAKVIPEVLFNYRNKPGSRNKQANLEKYDLLEYIYLKHAELYKENFEIFVRQWLSYNKKTEEYKQQVLDSLSYKMGLMILKPFRFFGFFKKI